MTALTEHTEESRGHDAGGGGFDVCPNQGMQGNTRDWEGDKE